MTQELLHGADVVASFQQVCCERVAQALAGASASWHEWRFQS